jgi:hypothetical protein
VNNSHDFALGTLLTGDTLAGNGNYARHDRSKGEGHEDRCGGLGRLRSGMAQVAHSSLFRYAPETGKMGQGVMKFPKIRQRGRDLGDAVTRPAQV